VRLGHHHDCFVVTGAGAGVLAGAADVVAEPDELAAGVVAAAAAAAARAAARRLANAWRCAAFAWAAARRRARAAVRLLLEELDVPAVLATKVFGGALAERPGSRPAASCV
jgi:hypothetical protein